MIKDDLSICIPTFNRADKLKVILSRLSELIDWNLFELVIVDNASTDHTSEVVQEWVPKLKCKVVYVKNENNIGGNANILRCFEKCKTRWAWIMGDDDTPENDALDKILKYLTNYSKDGLLINFSTEVMCLREKDIICNDLNSFLKHFDSYSNLLFISTSIYNAEVLKKHLITAYHYTYSMAPHLVLVLSGLNSGTGQVVLAKDIIIKFGEVEKKEQKWSYLHLFLGMSTLIEIPNTVSREAFNNFTSKVISHVILDKMLFDYLIKYYLTDPVLRKYLFNQIVSRNYKYFPGRSFGLRVKLLAFSLIINSDYLLKLYVKVRKIDLTKIDYPINIQPLYKA